MNRRDFLHLAGAAIGAATASSLFARSLSPRAAAAPAAGPYGPLLPADANDVQLPAGFRSRIVALGDQVVPGTGFQWHSDADGGACFPAPGGYVYVSNSESSNGGVGALRFDHRGTLLDAYSICSGTAINCAGGATPWGTWLSCEEFDTGSVWECDPLGVAPQEERLALGTFKHEAVAVDPARRQLYLTEDRSDGCLYRFTPDAWGDLSSGLLEVALESGGAVTWAEVPDPGARSTETRYQVSNAAPFSRGEGIDYRAGHVFFAATGEHRIYDLDVAGQTLSVFYDRFADPVEQLTQPDNVLATRSGDLLVAEDPGNLEIVLLTPGGQASPLLRLLNHGGSEIAGPAFDPLGRRLYFSSQRGGPGSNGVTFEVTGPFRRLV